MSPLGAVLVGLRRAGRMALPRRPRPMVDRYCYVCIPFGEKTGAGGPDPRVAVAGGRWTGGKVWKPVGGIYLNVYVCIPFRENTVEMRRYPGWRSLSLADPGLTYVSPSGNFPPVRVQPREDRVVGRPGSLRIYPLRGISAGGR